MVWSGSDYVASADRKLCNDAYNLYIYLTKQLRNQRAHGHTGTYYISDESILGAKSPGKWQA